MKFKFKIWQNIKSVWPVYKVEFGTLLTLALITALIKAGQSSEELILVGASYVVSILVTYAWIKYSLSLFNGEKKFKVFSVKSLPSLNDFWSFVLTVLLTAVIVIGGVFLLVIPAFYFGGRLIFSTYLSIDKKTSPLESVKQSWKMTKGNGWRLFWKSLVLGLFSVLGLLAFGIGWFVTFPIGMLVLTKMYLSFLEFKKGHHNDHKKEESEDLKTEQKAEIEEKKEDSSKEEVVEAEKVETEETKE